ncbi:hypothetical protein RRG08_022426 [Elysia crispata]|uniref:Uncharacterized protein n=1 Tax=Elysia crispata TaxID=231223 RepID=A0AAE0Z1C0_9GAST|nr:hypothetical protein RRG08_022426 [Elysia crispata]
MGLASPALFHSRPLSTTDTNPRRNDLKKRAQKDFYSNGNGERVGSRATTSENLGGVAAQLQHYAEDKDDIKMLPYTKRVSTATRCVEMAQAFLRPANVGVTSCGVGNINKVIRVLAVPGHGHVICDGQQDGESDQMGSVMCVRKLGDYLSALKLQSRHKVRKIGPGLCESVEEQQALLAHKPLEDEIHSAEE